jgi:cell division protein FtsN
MQQIVKLKIISYRRYSCLSGFLMICACLFVWGILFPLTAQAQEEPEYDEISVFLNIQRIGGIDIPAVIRDETVYLPVVDIFSFLKIRNIPSAQLDSVTGFFINPQVMYSINHQKNRIVFQGKGYELKSTDMIKTETNLYLRSNWFGEIFGLDCSFNFRSLSVSLNTKLELPIIREMRQEQMRTNINKLKGEVKSDTIIERKYPALHFGMADWSVISTQQMAGKTDVRLNLALGSVLAGGEANVLLNYNNNTPFTEKQQQYQWRFVNNDRPLLRQVTAGKIYSQVTSSIYDPVVGIQFTNTPTTYRRSFGTYTLSDITEPNWIVELYVNNVLVDYMKADASGFYKFEVPLVYGNSAVKLRFYGPWGEERTKEQNISIPFNFLPAKELEYSVSAGMVEDTLSSRFSRASLNYGISRRMTIGGGVEYLSSVINGNTMPYLSASMRILSGLLLTGEYTYKVRSKGLLSYRLPSNLQFELNYTKYEPGQKAIIYNYLEERKAVVSIPIKGKNFAAYSRMTVNQIVLPYLTNTNAEMLWSGSVYGVSTNFTTYGLFTDLSDPYIYSNLSLAFRLPGRFTITPQVQYEYNTSSLISARTNMEKPLFKRGFLNMSYEHNFRSNTRNIEFGFRYDLSFAQTGFSVRNTNDQTTLVASARGSLLYDAKTDYLGTTNRTNVGKGAITLLPFLDIDGNGKRDNGEPKAAGLQFRINGGTIIRNEKDTTIRILDLTPYTSYFLELDKNSFDNIAWQMHNLTMKVNIDANQFKTIEVPVSVMGEASGTVYTGSRGQGRILVCFYRNDSTLAARTLTESDGYYSYLGLKPGKYIARIDPEQLKKIKMTSSPDMIPVEINPNRDGDIVEGLDFNLSSLNREPVADTTATTNQVNPVSPPATPEIPAKPANKVTIAQETKTPANVEQGAEGKPTTKENELKSYQIGAYKIKAVALAATKILGELTAKPVVMISEGGYYKVRVTGLAGQEEADRLIYGIEHAQKKESVTKTAISERIKKPAAGKKFEFVIQVGAFTQEQNATKVKEELLRITGHPINLILEGGYYKVQVGGFNGWQQAQEFLPKIIGEGYSQAYLKRIKQP